VPKPLFHRSENFGLAMGLGIDDPIGMKPNSGESRREKVASGEAPQDRAFVARKNAGCEQRGARRVLPRGADLHDLMKGATGRGQPKPGDLADDARASARARTPYRRSESRRGQRRARAARDSVRDRRSRAHARPAKPPCEGR
jgi:hypothetical protein